MVSVRVDRPRRRRHKPRVVDQIEDDDDFDAECGLTCGVDEAA